MVTNDVTGHFFLTLHHHTTEGAAAKNQPLKWRKSSEVIAVQTVITPWVRSSWVVREYVGVFDTAVMTGVTVPNKVLWNPQRSTCLYFPVESDMNRWRDDVEKVSQIKSLADIFSHPQLVSFHSFLRAAWKRLSKILSEQCPQLS